MDTACFVIYKKGALDSQVITFTSCLPMVGASPTTITGRHDIAESGIKHQKSNCRFWFQRREQLRPHSDNSSLNLNSVSCQHIKDRENWKLLWKLQNTEQTRNNFYMHLPKDECSIIARSPVGYPPLFSFLVSHADHLLVYLWVI
jgi:hypothetical protein